MHNYGELPIRGREQNATIALADEREHLKLARQEIRDLREAMNYMEEERETPGTSLYNGRVIKLLKEKLERKDSLENEYKEFRQNCVYYRHHSYSILKLTKHTAESQIRELQTQVNRLEVSKRKFLEKSSFTIEELVDCEIEADKDASEKQQLKQSLAEAESLIELQGQYVKDKDAKTELQAQYIEHNDVRIKLQDLHIKDMDAKIELQRQELKEKDAKIELQKQELKDKDAKIRHLGREHKDKDAKIEHLGQEIKIKNAEIKHLAQEAQDEKKKTKATFKRLKQKLMIQRYGKSSDDIPSI